MLIDILGVQFSNWTSGNMVLVMSRCRFLKSVSVFGFLHGFLKFGSVFGVGFLKYRDIGIGFSVFLPFCFLSL